MAFDGNRDQHLANGGCTAVHMNGRWFCAGMQGHYNWFTSRHYVDTVTIKGGRPVESLHVEWN